MVRPGRRPKSANTQRRRNIVSPQETALGARVDVRCLRVAIFLTMATLSGAETPEYILSAIRSHTTGDVIRALIWVHDDCPFDWDAANEIVDGVFIRSRVRNEMDDGDLFLDVSINCLQDGARYIYTIRVRMDRWGITEPWVLDWDWGSFGVGSEDSVRRALRTRVEDAITDFIRAHMD